MILCLDKLNVLNLSSVMSLTLQSYQLTTATMKADDYTSLQDDDDISAITATIVSFISTPARLNLLFQWVAFVLTLCVFHLAEFFITAMYNPKVVNASSFVVNHSKAYTTAMLVSSLVIR